MDPCGCLRSSGERPSEPQATVANHGSLSLHKPARYCSFRFKSLLDCIITLCKLPYTTIRSLVSGHQEVQKERQRYREGQKIKLRAFRVGCDIISTMSTYSTALNAYTRTHSLQIRSLARYHCASGTVCAFWTNFDTCIVYNAWKRKKESRPYFKNAWPVVTSQNMLDK